jgi:ATP-dependent 26S proteasome regulatory subunit
MSANLSRAYADNAEHLLAEIGWLELLIRRAVLNARREHDRDQGDPFKGLYISDHEAERLVADCEPRQAADDDDSSLLLAQAAAARREIDERTRASLAAGLHLALPHLCRAFALTALEERILLLALAPEVDLKFERLFAWLQDDISKKRPCVDLAMHLFCTGRQEQLAARVVFAAEAPLLQARLIRPIDQKQNPLLGCPLLLDDLITQYLLAATSEAVGSPPFARRYATRRPLESLRWTERMRSEWCELVRAHSSNRLDGSSRLILHLHGAHGSGKKTLASCLCRNVEAGLMVADVQELANRGENFEAALRAIFRHGLLHRYAVYLEHVEPFQADDDKGAVARNALARSIADLSWLTFIATETTWSTGDLFHRHTFLTVDLPMPDIAQRDELWTALARESGLSFAPDVSWSELASKFRLTPGRIKGAIGTAANHARLRGPDTPIGRDDLHKGCYAQSNRKLATLARRLDARYTWNDITLPTRAMAQLQEVCGQVRHRRKVYNDWGFAETASLGKGLTVLFYGQSGVGKTMAVEIIANELQLEAFKIDLSTIVSKYIGETEKNLSRIFKEAESSNAILFFDEADALFGKRSEVKDAHDRYANIEINYLLQRMEEFEGLAILATNLRKNIDEGFFRRMRVVVEFPFPEAAHRYRIWQQHLPADAPVTDDIDFDYLAERFNLAGGNIRNVVVNAAFLAAESGSAIGMEHLIRATRREYEKIGRICTDMDFRPYHAWLAEAKTVR